jgi:squalene-associated FAD-dependent desaturase
MAEARYPRRWLAAISKGSPFRMSTTPQSGASATQPDVLIIGAGLAGLSAAVALSGAGANVSLLERKPYVGGRAYSYPHPALNEVIDSQHVLLGCCTNLIDLCKRAGADQHIRWYDHITFLEPATSTRPTSRRSDIGPSFLPAPGHSSLSFLSVPMLSLADKASIAIGLLDFLRGFPATDEEAFSTWLQRTKQTPKSIRHFWEPIIVGALNDSFERCSTRYAGQVFHESFLKSPEGGRLGIPSQPMSEFYASTACLAEQQGTTLRLRTSIDRIEHTLDGQWHAFTSDGVTHTAPQLILALPFEQTARLVASLSEQDRRALNLNFEAFTHAPITTIHLWFDCEITPLDHAAFLDTRIQWVFNKSRIRRFEPNQPAESGQYLELVISASFPELHMTREQIIASALEELASFFPTVRNAKLLKSGILKEARATFSVTPGLDQSRPVAATQVPGLYLAGDWTRTDWPSTMEGAVRSGRLAAEAVALATGNQANFLSPELPASGLMRLLAR